MVGFLFEGDKLPSEEEDKRIDCVGLLLVTAALVQIRELESYRTFSMIIRTRS